MNLPELPPDLAEMELQLQQRPRQEPAEGFRRRVLAAVERTVRDEVSLSSHSFWRFAAATAAAMLLAINFSMSAANDTNWQLAAPFSSEGVERNAEQIHLLLPETSEREARRSGLLLQARARSAPAPRVRLGSGRFVR
jgi:hypothetical protein